MAPSTDEIHERILRMIDGAPAADRIDAALWTQVQEIMNGGGFVAIPTDLPDFSVLEKYDGVMAKKSGDCGCGGPCCDEKKREVKGSEYEGLELKKFNYYARDADLDGSIQDGTPWQRRSRSLSHRAIGRRGKKPNRVRLQDLPFPYEPDFIPPVPSDNKPSRSRGGWANRRRG